MKYCGTLAFLLVLVFSCKKSDIDISNEDLTGCAPNFNCKYLFINNGSITESFLPTSGEYRLFSFLQLPTSQSATQISTGLYIKAPLEKDSFELRGEEIKQRAYYLMSCPSCDYVALRPISGTIKGVNSHSSNSPATSKWLLDIEVVLGAIHGNDRPIDTLRLKQYFYPTPAIK